MGAYTSPNVHHHCDQDIRKYDGWLSSSRAKVFPGTVKGKNWLNCRP